MALWDKNGKKPTNLTRAEKRNVVATPAGWVRRQNKTDVHGRKRTIDETLVAIGKLDVTMAVPNVSEIYLANSSGGSTLKAGASHTHSVYVVYDEPIVVKPNTGYLRITFANTVSGQNVVKARSNTNIAAVSGANNILRFTFSANVAGTYKINAQTMANIGVANVRSAYTSTHRANTVITGLVSNALGTFVIST